MTDAAKLKALERAVRAKCLDCSGGMRAEVRDCQLKDCPLWPFRGAGAPERIAAAAPGQGGRQLTGQMDINEIRKEAAAV